MSNTTTVEYKFNTRRSLLFFKCIVAFAAIVATVFAVGANDLAHYGAAVANHGAVERREFRTVGVEDGVGTIGPGSTILFPGAQGVSVAIDFVFFVGFPFAIIFFGTLLYFASSSTSFSSVCRNDARQLSRYWFVLVTIGTPVFVLLLHACGNFHYQLWCACGVIPSDNCFWLFDVRSFLAGWAGLIGLSALLLLLCGLGTLFLFVLSCRICFDRTVVVSKPSL